MISSLSNQFLISVCIQATRLKLDPNFISLLEEIYKRNLPLMWHKTGKG
ncbi:sporulation histidine kinase inhibitor Sda [Bacillus taeanensis]|uniref:Sporulation histidine kinase inhibitor Sda n=1 Tax=Bacillus taeanensis TaxID=273032 RepID=A0A366XVS2_9BACI|nr:hypothetical protein DS031_09440 [Bacillus taeanensis]